MKKILLLLSSILLFIIGYSQNAPIAVNDTLFVDFNDSIYVRDFKAKLILANDSDPDVDAIKLDSTYYIGSGFYKDSMQIIGPTTYFWSFSYIPALNYVGLDSIQYIIHDDGNPIRFDTATIYLFVKHQKYQQLNLNNINARLGLYSLFNDEDNAIAGFEVPKGSSSHSIFAANLWMAGVNQNDVYMNAETFGVPWYNVNKLTEFKSPSGPIMDSIYYDTTSYDFKWDRLWKVNQSDILSHQSNWNAGGYQPIEVIANWPAHGDTTKGQAYYLAPFIDNNNDGDYNPLDGDYPKIKGQQAVYYIYNDIRWQANTSEPMQSEVHYMAYTYNCTSDSALAHTVFVDYTIYNRSKLTYDSTYVGMWTDLDIGNSSDDFIGCDVARSTYYGYNGDDNDDNDYGVHPAAQGVTFLKGAQQDNDGIDNPFTQNMQDVIDSNGTPYADLGTGFGDGILDNEHWGMEHFMYYNKGLGAFLGDGDPMVNTNYYNYLKSFWRDNTHLVWGGNGNSASTGGTIPAKYMFPGDSDPLWYGTNGVNTTPSDWNETNAGNAPGDRRGVGSTGPFTFEPDSSVEITMAFVFGRDYQTTGAQAGVVVMQERIDSIQSYFKDGFARIISSCGLPTSVKNDVKKSNLLVYPNPFSAQFNINYSTKNNNATLEVYNILGERILSQSIQQDVTTIDLSSQKKGIYFIRIVDGENLLTQKVIKQ